AHVDPRAVPFAGAMPNTIFASGAPFDGVNRRERGDLTPAGEPPLERVSPGEIRSTCATA
ncbi:MAG TPA: hypothetical protein VIA18_25960, partial [Polyangia bacterium]|nr:hypothetical protein [Polyangia bacterium]